MMPLFGMLLKLHQIFKANGFPYSILALFGCLVLVLTNVDTREMQLSSLNKHMDKFIAFVRIVFSLQTPFSNPKPRRDHFVRFLSFDHV